MNKIIAGIASIMMCACSSEEMPNLRGELSGMQNDTIIVFASNPIARKSVCIDTIPLVDNKFELNLPDSLILNVSIIEKPQGNNAIRMRSNTHFILLPGDKISLKGELNDDINISSPLLYDKLNNIPEISEAEKKFKLLLNEYSSLYSDREKNKEKIEEMKKQSKDMIARIEDAKLKYVKQNIDCLVSAYFVTQMGAKKGTEAYTMLTDNIKDGVMGEMLSQVMERNKNTIAREKARENIQPGKAAPEFRLKNLKDEEMTLTSFRGKYVLLDFWGTWCGWCIKGMPKMKQYYAKYKNKMEIVGINCRDTEDKWRAGVKELKLPWTNLYNGNSNEITNNYAIAGYPTKILIDPKGKIVEVFVGESDAMYKKLDKMF